jgi:hypothetical protein
MCNDEIVAEVRKAREEYVADHHGDIDEIYNDLKAKEQASERSVVCFPPKRPSQSIISHKEDVDTA